MEEADYKKELADAGVDLPELKDAPKEEPKAEEPKEPVEPKAEEPKEPEAPLQEPKEQRKRSIYDEYKDKKAEARTEKERADSAERERDELKAKLAAVDGAKTEPERQDALDDVDEFISKHKEWNKDAIKEFIGLTRKGLKPELPDDLVKRIERFEAWEKTNSAAIEKQMFEDEFKSSMPKLEKMFGKASPDELDAIKSELDKLSHTKAWHDKPLAFIAFENQDTLQALVSPKKRGMESKDRKDGGDLEFEFDPNADYSKLTPEQKVKWEEGYQRMMGKKDGLLTDGEGRKILI
jgi:hypothetical protein